MNAKVDGNSVYGTTKNLRKDFLPALVTITSIDKTTYVGEMKYIRRVDNAGGLIIVPSAIGLVDNDGRLSEIPLDTIVMFARELDSTKTYSRKVKGIDSYGMFDGEQVRIETVVGEQTGELVGKEKFVQSRTGVGGAIYLILKDNEMLYEISLAHTKRVVGLEDHVVESK